MFDIYDSKKLTSNELLKFMKDNCVNDFQIKDCQHIIRDYKSKSGQNIERSQD